VKMRRKCLVFFENRWARAGVILLLGFGVPAGIGPVVGMWGAGGAVAQASGSGKRALANTPASVSVNDKTKSARTYRGKRDPFRTPAPPRTGGGEAFLGPRLPGKRGLVIGQLELKGVVLEDASKGMIAVVTNQTNRAYFLRVHDEVYNGIVGEITADAIHFRENRLGTDGRLETEEVVLKLGAQSREGR